MIWPPPRWMASACSTTSLICGAESEDQCQQRRDFQDLNTRCGAQGFERTDCTVAGQGRANKTGFGRHTATSAQHGEYETNRRTTLQDLDAHMLQMCGAVFR